MSNSNSQLHKHHYVERVILSTCTEQGYTIHTCKCGDEYRDSYTPMHAFGEWVQTKRPSCIEEGEEIRQCTNCSATERRSLPALGHDFTDWEPSSTDEKREERFCRRCNTKRARSKDYKKKRITFAIIASFAIFLVFFFTLILPKARVLVYYEGGKLPKDANGWYTKIIIKDGVRSIPDSAFAGCRKVKEVAFSDSVTTIGSDAFCFCFSLTEIKIPGNISTIGGCAFWMCTGLKTVELENGVRIIGDSAFSECSSLSTILIPDSVKKIGSSAFPSTMKSIYYTGTKKQWQSIEGASLLQYRCVIHCLDGDLGNE